MGASKALPVPRLVLVRHSPGGDHLVAFYTPGCKFLFVAASTVDLLLTRNETLGANWALAHATCKTFLVPLSRLVFHLLGAYTQK